MKRLGRIRAAGMAICVLVLLTLLLIGLLSLVNPSARIEVFGVGWIVALYVATRVYWRVNRRG